MTGSFRMQKRQIRKLRENQFQIATATQDKEASLTPVIFCVPLLQVRTSSNADSVSAASQLIGCLKQTFTVYIVPRALLNIRPLKAYGGLMYSSTHS